MLLGFTSLLLTVSEKSIANICIPKGAGETLIPCASITFDDAKKQNVQSSWKLNSEKGTQVRTCIYASHKAWSLEEKTGEPASSPLVLDWRSDRPWKHMQIRRSESWEGETRTLEYQFAYDPRRYQLTGHTPFGKRHLNYWSNNSVMYWPVCLVRQFYRSVPRVDYFTLRHGFIMAHFSEESNFDFQKYIERALEKDFGVVVGLRWWIWIFSVLYIFFNANARFCSAAFYSHFWQPFIPLMMGTSMRKSVFTENVIRGIQIWQDKAKKKYTSSALNEIVVADQKISPSQKCSIFSKYPDMLANLGHACCFLSMEHSI
ncbi:MLO-like protein 6 [Glycine max]|nr:MLO-like protein 6 [Glycine max]